MTIGHDELARLLAGHLRGNSDRMVWCDMQLGPSGSPRPDVWSLNKSYSKPRPLAYEVKVSKADYQRDVSSGKWQNYLAYSCAVTFAVPHGLVTKAELPKGCGLMTWNGSSWNTAKGPTLNPAPRFSHDVMMKLLIDGADRASAHYRLKAKSEWHADRAIAKKFGETVARVIREETDFDRRLEMVRERYREAEQRERERYEARRKEDERLVMQAHRQLCEAVGLPSDCSPWDLRNRVWELARAVSRDHEVRQLRQQLETIRGALEAAEKPENAGMSMEAELAPAPLAP